MKWGVSLEVDADVHLGTVLALAHNLRAAGIVSAIGYDVIPEPLKRAAKDKPAKKTRGARKGRRNTPANVLREKRTAVIEKITTMAKTQSVIQTRDVSEALREEGLKTSAGNLYRGVLDVLLERGVLRRGRGGKRGEFIANPKVAKEPHKVEA